jgi:uncharacterized protein
VTEAQRVEIEHPRGPRLVARLHGEFGPSMAISCHGMLSTKDGQKHVLLADQLAAQGIGTLRFDFAGRGESDGDLFDLSYSGEVRDLNAVIDFAISRGAQRLGLFGSSMGGSVALLAAARDERVIAVATLAAVAYPNEIEARYPKECHLWRERGYVEFGEGRIGGGFLDDALQHDVLSAVGVLLAPILVIHGSEDDVVPVSDAHDIATTARNASLQIVDGADHRFSEQHHLRPAMRQVAEFLRHRLLEG